MSNLGDLKVSYFVTHNTMKKMITKPFFDSGMIFGEALICRKQV